MTGTAKAIVFGGAGFIGSHLLARLTKDSHYTELYSVDIAKPRLAICARSKFGVLACSRNSTNWLVDNQALGSKPTDYDVYPIPPLH